MCVDRQQYPDRLAVIQGSDDITSQPVMVQLELIAISDLWGLAVKSLKVAP
jgi:hypothetical protein